MSIVIFPYSSHRLIILHQLFRIVNKLKFYTNSNSAFLSEQLIFRSQILSCSEFIILCLWHICDILSQHLVFATVIVFNCIPWFIYIRCFTLQQVTICGVTDTIRKIYWLMISFQRVKKITKTCLFHIIALKIIFIFHCQQDLQVTRNDTWNV